LDELKQLLKSNFSMIHFHHNTLNDRMNKANNGKKLFRQKCEIDSELLTIDAIVSNENH